MFKLHFRQVKQFINSSENLRTEDLVLQSIAVKESVMIYH